MNSTVKAVVGAVAFASVAITGGALYRSHVHDGKVATAQESAVGASKKLASYRDKSALLPADVDNIEAVFTNDLAAVDGALVELGGRVGEGSTLGSVEAASAYAKLKEKEAAVVSLIGQIRGLQEKRRGLDVEWTQLKAKEAATERVNLMCKSACKLPRLLDIHK